MAALALTVWSAGMPPASAETPTDRGEYILRAAGCVACHTDSENDGAFLAGGRALVTPFGTFYTPNITPDPATGLGRWTEQQLRAALTEGEGPDAIHYYPAFPFTAYSGMKPEDITALYAYLRTVPAVELRNRPHELPWYFRFRFLNRLWKLLFFTPQSTPAGRGEYLVKVLGHCDECHTPRNPLGAIIRERHLGGNPLGPDGEPVPNITPDRETGIGRWGRSDLIRYLKSGRLPDSDFAGGAMVDVIDEGLSFLAAEDIAAIADYLRALPPAGH